MKELAERFCRKAEERRGLRYPAGLRRLAVEYAVCAERDGRSRREVAAALRLPEATLERWRQTPAAAGEIHEVKVMEAAADRAVLVMPSGVRVERLRLDELVSILAALG
jgi:hypothetical protein